MEHAHENPCRQPHKPYIPRAIGCADSVRHSESIPFFGVCPSLIVQAVVFFRDAVSLGNCQGPRSLKAVRNIQRFCDRTVYRLHPALLRLDAIQQWHHLQVRRISAYTNDKYKFETVRPPLSDHTRMPVWCPRLDAASLTGSHHSQLRILMHSCGRWDVTLLLLSRGPWHVIHWKLNCLNQL